MDFDSEPETDTSTSSSPEDEEELWKTNSDIQAKESKSMSTDTDIVMKVQIKRSYGKKFKVRTTGHLIAIFKNNGIKQNLSQVEYDDLKHTAYLISRVLESRSIRFTGDYSCINKHFDLDDTDEDLVPPIEADHYVPWWGVSRLYVIGRITGYTTNRRIPMIHIDGDATVAGDRMTLRENKLYLVGGVGLAQALSRCVDVQREQSREGLVEIEVGVKSTWFSPKDSDCRSWRVREDIYAKSRSDPAFLFKPWSKGQEEFADMELEFKAAVTYWGLCVKYASQKQVTCVENMHGRVMEKIQTKANSENVSLEDIQSKWKSDANGVYVEVSVNDCQNRLALLHVLYPMVELHNALTDVNVSSHF